MAFFPLSYTDTPNDSLRLPALMSADHEVPDTTMLWAGAPSYWRRRKIEGILQTLCKHLCDSVRAHPNKHTGLCLCKLLTPPRLPRTAQRKMSPADEGALIVHFYLRYSFAAISLTTG